MEKKRIDSPNGKQRRSKPDRRSSERRDPERKSGKGTLTTRVGERRQKSRRSKDPKTG
ncbi:MAG: hypothetical protein AABN34_09835 [Acidobacteriota bacterium]